MPRRFELGTLVTAAKELADMENQDNVSTVTWKRFLSTQNGLLHGIVAESGLRYFEVAATFSTTTDMDAAGTVLEPNDHLSTVWVCQLYPDGRRRPLTELMAPEQLYAMAPGGQDACFWSFVDDRLFLMPKPATNQTYELRYVPQPADLATAADDIVVDCVTPAGEGFLLYGACVRALLKQDKDPRFHRDERDEHRKEVETWAQLRALHSRRRQVVEEMADLYVDPADWRYGRP